MNKYFLRAGLAGGICALGLMQPPDATAQVSTEDFNALKAAVQQLSDQVQSLRETNIVAEQTHEKDLQQLQDLKAKLAQTDQTATAAMQAQSQPPPRAPIDEATVNHNFQILGDAEFQYTKATGQHGDFSLADFAPIFLYRGGDNVLFEAGFDFILQNNGGTPGTLTDSAGDIIPTSNSPGYTTTINLSFAQLDYMMNDYLTLCVGNLLLPLGTYSERSAGWLNKFPDSPLVRDFVPGTGIGAELRGAVAIGDSGKTLNYSVYGVNGPGSADGTGTASMLDIAGGNVGIRSDGVVANLHGGPSEGGRLGVFIPYKPHYDLEMGISGQSGNWDNTGSHLWSAGVLDASLHLGSNIELKGEYVMTSFGSDDLGLVRQQGWWAQAGYKLAGLDLDIPVLNNSELLGRYDYTRDGFGTETGRYSFGYVYYITSALLFEGDYEILQSTDPTQPVNQLILQLSYGF